VWSEHLAEVNNWILGKTTDPPRKGMLDLKGHLDKTRQTSMNSGSIANWFANKIVSIASNSPANGGNIYRMGGYIFTDLLDPSCRRKRNTQDKKKLLAGQCGLVGEWKRLWVLLRGLRRDNSLIKCLFQRALSTVTNGQKALEYWYSDDYFDPRECQLPVDDWVKKNWIKLMEGSTLSKQQLELLADAVKPRVVAQQAKRLADQYHISPSIFDVLFLARE
jgi:hypothetical protein